MSATQRSAPSANPDLPTATVAACANAALAAIVGLAIALIVGVGAWALAPHAADSSPETAVRSAASIWVLAHHVPIELPTGSLSLSPLGLMFIPAALLYVAGRQVARVAKPRRPQDLLRFLVPMALTYGLVTAIVAGVAAPEEVQAHAWAAFAAGLSITFVSAGVAMARASGLMETLWVRLPLIMRESLLGGTVGLCALLAVGAFVATMALLVGFPEAVDMFRALDADVFGGIVLAVLCVCFIPNLVLWATAFSTGIGFEIGLSGTVSPRGVEHGALPVFPPLTALPPEGKPGTLALLSLLAPVLAGIVTGLFLYRRLPQLNPQQLAARAGISGLCCGAMLAALAWLSSGSLATGEFASVGPVWWSVGVVAALEVGLVASAVAWESQRRKWSRAWSIDLRGQGGRLMGKFRSR